MIEVDFMWVGEKTKTGDAIACRFTHPETGTPVVMVIDAGFREDGARLADLVRTYYNVDRVDLAVCTHPDDDHIQGLFGVFENLRVDELLIHRPSYHGHYGDEVKASTVDDLITVAVDSGTKIRHGFAGTTLFGGALTIAGPTEAYYVEQLRLQEQAVLSAWVTGSLQAKAAHGGQWSGGWVSSDPGETLTDDNGGTTPRNNSSLILNLVADGERILFTGDAGAPALTRAADYLDSIGMTTPISVLDVPHHGSRHNLTRDLLDRLLGGRTDDERGEAIVSVGKEADEFPRPEVANALKRRGYPCYATRGKNVWWHRNASPRRAYGPAAATGWLYEGSFN